MTEKINTLSTPEQPSSDSFADNLEIQAGLQESQAAAQRLFEQSTPSDVSRQVEPASTRETEPKKGISRGAKIGFTLGATAGVLTGVVAGAAYGGANENAHNDSETIIASSSFTPNPEYGNLDGPAETEVQDLLEANGLNPNQFSYDDIRAEISNATRELSEATGETVVHAGEPFDVDLITSTGVFGEKRTSIDITPSRLADTDKSEPVNE